MGHRFTYVVSPEEERENLTVEWFLRRHGYSRHIITGLKRTEDGIFRNGVRAWTSQAVHAGDVIETHLVETEPSDGILPRPVPFSVVYEDDAKSRVSASSWPRKPSPAPRTSCRSRQ